MSAPPTLLRRLVAATSTTVLAAAVLAACGSDDSSPSASDEVTIGVLEIAKVSAIDDAVAAFEKEVRAGLAPRKVTFELKNANGDQSLISSISRDFAGSDLDGFAVIGTPAVTALAQQVTDRPIFAIAMGDPVGAKVAASLDEPGSNVTGSIDYVEPAELLETIATSSPAPKRIGTVYDPSNQNMAVWSKALDKAADAAGVTVVPATISGPNDVTTAGRSLSGRVDAILIGPDATVLGAVDAVGAVATSAKIPLYVVGGDTSVAGVAASIGPDYADLGTSAGQGAVKVLTGGSAATTPFATPSQVGVSVNAKTFSALGITPPKDAS